MRDLKSGVLAAALLAISSSLAAAHFVPWRTGESRQLGFGHCAKGPCTKRTYWGEGKPHRHVDGKVVFDKIVIDFGNNVRRRSELLGHHESVETSSRPIILAHAQDFRHCHNIATRVFCHKRDSLPRNWPPLSDTPSSNTTVQPLPRLHWHGNQLVLSCDNPHHVRKP